MRDWWQMWPRFFQQTTCERIVRHCLKIPPVEGLVGLGDKPAFDAGWRLSTIRWVRPEGVMKPFMERMRTMFDEANKAFGFDLGDLREAQFTEYRAREDGRKDHYDWHEDLSWVVGPGETTQRKASMVIQLSRPEDYEGGELLLKFSPPTPTAIRAQGTAIAFPAFHPHCVRPVTSGVRYSLVAWCEGPCFR